ncbi:MAG TPA: hypothetical protein VFY16_11460 [Gemmatimonadaceae bacterium]|nr:hypothetical protein [Gemmatimonadaceae bacterium]
MLTAPIPSRSIAFTLHADGRISDVSFRDTREVAPLDATLLAGLRGKSKAPEMQTLIHDLATDSVLLELRTEYDR